MAKPLFASCTHYIIKVNGFDDVAKDTLDEWIYYLKNNRIKDEFTAKGLNRAREILAFDTLTEDEQKQYLRDADEKVMRDAEIRSALNKGRNEGLEEGETIGLEKGEAIGLEKGEAIGLEKGEAERTQLEEKLLSAQERIAELERMVNNKKP